MNDQRHMALIRLTLSKLLALEPLLYQAHEFAYWPTSAPSSDKITGTRSGSKAPLGGDAPARDAYRSAVQSIAKAYYQTFNASLNDSEDFWIWKNAEYLVPVSLVTPHPQEVAVATRITAEGIAKYHLEFPFVKFNESNQLTDCAALYVRNAYAALTNVSNKSREELQQAIQRQRTRWTN